MPHLSPGTTAPDVAPRTQEATFCNHLNPQQYAAVSLPDEHALILAGAGSGKTRVLTTRIAWLMQQGRVGPGGLMAVTFTNKAAKEMLTRLAAMLPLNTRGMWIGTFHGLCNRLLRLHCRAANLPSTFQILDVQDQLSALRRVYKAHNIDDEKFPAKQTAWFISGCKEEGLRPKDVVARDSTTRRKIEIFELYEAQCQLDGVVDFSELMLRSYELLRDDGELRSHYQNRFRHILIDEFQDTNRLQYAWIRLFAGDHNCIFAVGDDDQSIYAFRGARVGNMADFVKDFNVSHQIKLEQNYRSHSNILDSANELISHNAQRLGKNLRTDQGAGELVRIYEASGDFAEAQWMIDELTALVHAGTRMSEIAVLYRSNAQSRVLETALFNAGLPYRVYGGVRFFERTEIKHALAYLRLLENPNDDTSFLRVVNFPPRGIGARSLEQLHDVATQTQQSLYSASALLGGRAAQSISAFVSTIETLRMQANALSLREIIELMLEHSRLLAHYAGERDGADRVENLKELISAAQSFVRIEGFEMEGGMAASPGAAGSAEGEQGDAGEMSALAAFLAHAALEAGDNQAQAGREAIQMMTVHAAKGLEFDAVFITGLEEGLFPHENSVSERAGLEEERRLMYVAMTRAKKRLYISYAQTRMLHGQTRYGLRSRFLEELPRNCLKWIAPPVRGIRANYARTASW